MIKSHLSRISSQVGHRCEQVTQAEFRRLCADSSLDTLGRHVVMVRRHFKQETWEAVVVWRGRRQKVNWLETFWAGGETTCWVQIGQAGFFGGILCWQTKVLCGKPAHLVSVHQGALLVCQRGVTIRGVLQACSGVGPGFRTPVSESQRR